MKWNKILATFIWRMKKKGQQPVDLVPPIYPSHPIGFGQQPNFVGSLRARLLYASNALGEATGEYIPCRFPRMVTPSLSLAGRDNSIRNLITRWAPPKEPRQEQ